MKNKHRIISSVVVLVIIAILFVLSFFIPEVRNFLSPEYIRDLIVGFGFGGYFVFILILALIIPSPLPSTAAVLAAGYVYGTATGTILSLIAAPIGGSIAFLFIRKFGKPLLEKFIDRHHIAHFNHIFKKRGITAVLISYAVPIFPDDSLNFILGLTKMKYHTFLFLSTVGLIPRYLILTSFGHDLYYGFTLKSVIVIAIIVVFSLMVIFRNKVKKLFFRELKEIEKDAGLIEKKINGS